MDKNKTILSSEDAVKLPDANKANLLAAMANCGMQESFLSLLALTSVSNAVEANSTETEGMVISACGHSMVSAMAVLRKYSEESSGQNKKNNDKKEIFDFGPAACVIMMKFGDDECSKFVRACDFKMGSGLSSYGMPAGLNEIDSTKLAKKRPPIAAHSSVDPFALAFAMGMTKTFKAMLEKPWAETEAAGLWEGKSSVRSNSYGRCADISLARVLKSDQCLVLDKGSEMTAALLTRAPQTVATVDPSILFTMWFSENIKTRGMTRAKWPGAESSKRMNSCPSHHILDKLLSSSTPEDFDDRISSFGWSIARSNPSSTSESFLMRLAERVPANVFAHAIDQAKIHRGETGLLEMASDSGWIIQSGSLRKKGDLLAFCAARNLLPQARHIMDNIPGISQKYAKDTVKYLSARDAEWAGQAMSAWHTIVMENAVRRLGGDSSDEPAPAAKTRMSI